jgi:hypothetical protein
MYVTKCKGPLPNRFIKNRQNISLPFLFEKLCPFPGQFFSNSAPTRSSCYIFSCWLVFLVMRPDFWLLFDTDWIAHCNENPIHVILFWELRGLSPNLHIHVSVSDLYIPKMGPHISLQQNTQTDPGNI